MKISTYAITIITSLFLTINIVNAQAFQKGNKNIDLGLGVGAYGTTTTFTVSFFGIPLSFTENDGAASTMVPISFEYGISNKIGLGVQLGYSNYFIDDSNDVKVNGIETGEKEVNTTESVKSIDFAIKINFHLLNAEKNDLFIGLALGGSSVNWLDKSGEELKGSGSYVSLYLTDRIFFSDHIGILFNLGYTGYQYANVTSSSNSSFITSLEWKLKGVNIGTGLAVKF
ncbi:MAG: hypothetical protein A3K10_07820 [Bacteroidetes bacterium RIFCSPLOWO2_12_FULL_31_6]|nr:MAG: hypothetical protein A3K10_07820 [Bacteroidetes bacterium RIFCSPLOWO2_12_FULL_31_6]